MNRKRKECSNLSSWILLVCELLFFSSRASWNVAFPYLFMPRGNVCGCILSSIPCSLLPLRIFKCRCIYHPCRKCGDKVIIIYSKSSALSAKKASGRGGGGGGNCAASISSGRTLGETTKVFKASEEAKGTLRRWWRLFLVLSLKEMTSFTTRKTKLLLRSVTLPFM